MKLKKWFNDLLILINLFTLCIIFSVEDFEFTWLSFTSFFTLFLLFGSSAYLLIKYGSWKDE